MIILDILMRISAALLVLVALFGFGEALSRQLKLRLPPFQSATLGLCGFLVAGGLLGALGLYHRPVIAAEILGGAGAAIYYLSRRLREGTAAIRLRDVIAALPFAAAGLLVLLTAQHGYWFIQGDDMQGYLPLIRKLSDTGVLGDSSFSEKRLFDLGGAGILQAVFVGGFGASAVNLADLGVGGMLVLGLIGERAAMRRAGFFWSAVLALAALMLNEDGRPVSPVLLIEALCLMLGLLLLDDAPPKRGYAIAWGLLVGSLIALKLTAVVFLGIVSIGIFARDWSVRGLRPAFTHAAIAVMTAMACLAPFWFASWKYVGTPWFPLLGTGFQEAALGDGFLGRAFANLANVESIIFASDQLQIVLLVALGVALFAALAADKVHAVRNLTLAATMAVTVVQIVWSGFAAGDSDQDVRYALPLYGPVLLLLLLEWRLLSAGRPLPGWVLAGGVAVAIPYCARDPNIGHPSIAKSDLVYGLTGSSERAHALFHPFPIFPLTEGGEAMARLQQAAVPGARMLVFVDRPFLFDFGRNRIETADCPGRVSPPPGLPLYRDDEAIVSYLRATGIRYLAFSYGNDNNYSPALLEMRTSLVDHPWGAYCARAMYTMHAFLRRVRSRFRTVYDDGNNFLLDLDGPPDSAGIPQRRAL